MGFTREKQVRMIQVAVVLIEWKEKSCWILRLCLGEDAGLSSGPGKGTKPAKKASRPRQRGGRGTG